MADHKNQVSMQNITMSKAEENMKYICHGFTTNNVSGKSSLANSSLTPKVCRTKQKSSGQDLKKTLLQKYPVIVRSLQTVHK